MQTSIILDYTKNGYKLIANRTIDVDEKIYNSYLNCLDYDNSKVIKKFGNYSSNTQGDPCELKLYLNSLHDPLYEYKLSVFGKKKDGFRFVIHNDFTLRNIGALLAYCRIAEANKKVELKCSHEFYKYNPISLENEKRVFINLENIFRNKLKEYNKELFNNKTILEDEFLTINQKNCIKAMLSEINILYKMIDYVEAIFGILNSKFICNVKEREKRSCEIEEYIKSIDKILIK